MELVAGTIMPVTNKRSLNLSIIIVSIYVHEAAVSDQI